MVDLSRIAGGVRYAGLIENSSSIESLPQELLQNVAQRLTPQELSRLAQTNRAMNNSLRPNLVEGEVTASAQKVNSLPKLQQLLGQTPVRRSQHWQPRHTLQDLSPSQQVRPLLVLAARVEKVLPVAHRLPAERLVRNEPTLASPHELNSSMKNLLGAGKSLITNRGASVTDAARLFAYNREPQAFSEYYQQGLEQTGRNAGRQAVSKREPVDKVVSRLGLNQGSRMALERHAVENFGVEELAAENSVSQVMKKLGVSGEEARQTLEVMQSRL